MTDNEHKVLEYFCLHEFDMYTCWIPMPSTCVSSALGISLYQTRKAIKSLVQQGYLYSDKYGGQTDDGKVFCIRGYFTTRKVVGIEEHRTAFEKGERLKECIGFSSNRTYEQYCEQIMNKRYKE